MKSLPTVLNFVPMLARTLIFLGLGLVGSVVRAQGPVPTPFPADFYNKMASHSPFAPPTAPVATPPPATPPPVPSFAEKLTAQSIMKTDKGFAVMILDQDTQQRTLLNSESSAKPGGVEIVSVKWNPAAKSETALITLRKNGQTGTVRYEPTAGGGGGAGGNGGGGIPNLPRPGNGIMPPGNRTFTPPNTFPGAVPAGNGTQVPPGVQAIRRPPIRTTQPQPPPAAGGRPVVLPGTNPQQPVRPGVVADDDDDDDDE